jgi:hypothetical protein
MEETNHDVRGYRSPRHRGVPETLGRPTNHRRIHAGHPLRKIFSVIRLFSQKQKMKESDVAESIVEKHTT